MPHKVTPSLLALALICFLLPWVSISCEGRKAGSLTGVQMVLGTTIDEPQMFGPPKPHRINGEPLALFAALAGGLALTLSLMGRRKEQFLPAIAGFIAAGLMLALKSKIETEVTRNTGGLIAPTFELGFWLSLGGFAGAGALAAKGWLRVDPTAATKRRCASCQRLNLSTASFCADCGSELKDAPPITAAPPMGAAAAEERPDEDPAQSVLLAWIGEHKYVSVSGAALVILIVIGYSAFLAPNPERDGSAAARATCQCSIRDRQAEIAAREKFVQEFDTAKFSKRADANRRLGEIAASERSARVGDCFQASATSMKTARLRYEQDSTQLKNFDSAFAANRCELPDEPKLLALSASVSSKIDAIHEAKPDADAIKASLLGKGITGWNFDYLSEFRDVKILDETITPSRVEYKTVMTLIDQRTSNVHEAELMLVYVLNADGSWVLQSHRANYIAYENNAPVGEWQRVQPIQAVRFEIEDKHRIVLRAGNDRTEYLIGPDVPPVQVPSAYEYFIKSREATAVSVQFKYFPQ